MSHYEALIASANPDHWRHIDLKLMQGKTLSVKIEGPNAAGIGLVRTSDTIPGKVPAYQEPERSKVQFSPLRGWMNDTAGLIFYQGTWNLYFGHTRFNNQVAMANNAWGHATSNISQPAEIIAEFDPGSATQIAFTGAELGIS